MKVSGGATEGGVVVGNAYDKYGSRNPIVRKLMEGFEKALATFIRQVSPNTIHEVGCGEGYWVLQWLERGIEARGSDFSSHVIGLAQQNAKAHGHKQDIFVTRSIYDLEEVHDGADLIVCCEVLEHLDRPEDALRTLQKVVKGHLILSVPREPIWCALNLARGKYLTSLGNTPGHIQRWPTHRFIRMIQEYFEVVDVRTPLPWTMVLCRPHG